MKYTLLLALLALSANAAQQTVGVGSAANDGTGDPARTAFTKLNANDTELYSLISALNPAAATTVLCNATALSAAPTACTNPVISGISLTATTTKSGSTLLPAQFGILQQITQGGSPTSIDNAYVNLFLITDNQDSSGSTDGGRSGGMYIDYTFGASSKRGKEAFATAITGVANQDATGTTRFYVGQTSYVFPVANGGTNGSERGAWLGGNANVQIQTNGGKYIYAINPWEDDVANADTTTKLVFGHLVDFLTANTAAPSMGSLGYVLAAETTIASGNAGVECGFCVGSPAHFWPMATTGSIFSNWKNNQVMSAGLGLNTGTVANVLYMPTLTVSGYDIALPGHTVDGNGIIGDYPVGGSVVIGGPAATYNSITITPNTTGAGPIIIASGVDTNAALHLRAKGTSGVALANNSGTISFTATSDGTTAGSQWNLHGMADGNSLAYATATGDDTNIDMELRPKGTGVVRSKGGTQSTGTKFTVTGTGACSSTSTTVGGAAAGSFLCTGTAGASTATITINGATGSVADHGWACSGGDATSGVAWSPSGAAATTTGTMSGTIATTSDRVVFSCTGY